MNTRVSPQWNKKEDTASLRAYELVLSDGRTIGFRRYSVAGGYTYQLYLQKNGETIGSEFHFFSNGEPIKKQPLKYPPEILNLPGNFDELPEDYAEAYRLAKSQLRAD